MLGLKLNHVSKRGSRLLYHIALTWLLPDKIMASPLVIVYHRVIGTHSTDCVWSTGACLPRELVLATSHDDVIKCKPFPCYWPFVRGIHRPPMDLDYPHKGQERGSFMLSSICAWSNVWANNRNTVDLRRHRVHYDVTAMKYRNLIENPTIFHVALIYPCR